MNVSKSLISKLLGFTASLVISASASASIVTFDNTFDTEVKGASAIDFSDFTVTAGYTSSLNLGNTGTFTTTNTIYDALVYWDTNPGNGGLGVVSSLNSGDGLDSNFKGNARTDEILFFEFNHTTTLDTVWFNGNHKDLVNSDSDGTIYERTDALFNIYASNDGVTYTSVFDRARNGHYQQAPIDRDYLNTNVSEQYTHYAVAATGWGSHSSYVEQISYSSVTEPATLALLGLGILALGAARRRSAK